MATRSALRLLFRDELIGFAKSKVMIVLWVLLPALAIGAYLLLPDELTAARGFDRQMTASAFVGFILSSIAGTAAALMVAVDLVSERNRKVYDLFVIRPLRRESILIAKVAAVFLCVAVACVVSLLLGLVVDIARGATLSADLARDLGKSLLSLTGVIAMSSATGVLFGVLSKSIVVAVLLILYVGQNLAIVPMLPVYLGILPDKFSLVMAISAGLTLVLLGIAAYQFRREDM